MNNYEIGNTVTDDKEKISHSKIRLRFFNALFHNVLMGEELYNLHQIKDNFIIFQSYIDIFELKPAKNGGKSV